MAEPYAAVKTNELHLPLFATIQTKLKNMMLKVGRGGGEADSRQLHPVPGSFYKVQK